MGASLLAVAKSIYYNIKNTLVNQDGVCKIQIQWLKKQVKVFDESAVF